MDRWTDRYGLSLKIGGGRDLLRDGTVSSHLGAKKQGLEIYR